MYYVYMLQNPEDGEIYIGYSGDLKRRYKEHQEREHPGWKLVYYEAFLAEKDARVRERKLKHHGRGVYLLKDRLKESLTERDN